MKFIVTKPTEIDVQKVRIDISPRHIGNGDDYDLQLDTPMLNETKDSWQADVMIGSGQILDWPDGIELDLYCKVCDAGSYHLLDNEDNVIASIEDNYVPHGVVPGDYGDYVDLKIGSDGVIKNWPQKPDVSEFFKSDDDY